MKIGLRKVWLAITPSFFNPIFIPLGGPQAGRRPMNTPVEMTKVSSVRLPSPARDGVKIARFDVIPEVRIDGVYRWALQSAENSGALKGTAFRPHVSG
jgi:hypothetical protein